MKKNESNLDRGIRFALGVVFAAIAIAVGAVWLKVLFGALAAISIFTAASGFCLLYVPFGINTCKVPDKKGDDSLAEPSLSSQN